MHPPADLNGRINGIAELYESNGRYLCLSIAASTQMTNQHINVTWHTAKREAVDKFDTYCMWWRRARITSPHFRLLLKLNTHIEPPRG